MDQLREAMFYRKVGESGVVCDLCPHHCTLSTGQSGKCRGRENQDGKLIAVNYGKHMGLGVDPIEKKPLYHFRPGSKIISLGANSCNLSCFFCQNYGSSQFKCNTEYLSPQELFELVRKFSIKQPMQVAFTYTEPFTWFEYIYDFTCMAPDVDVVLVTNGYVNSEPLQCLLPRIKAMNIDLKSIRPQFYKDNCGGQLEPVMDTIRAAYSAGVHLEITNLLIPGLNDTDHDISLLAEFVASVNRDIPLHISAYHPAYKSDIEATRAKDVIHACEIASRTLSHVYAGNIMASSYSATCCPHCGKEVISSYRNKSWITPAGKCPNCDFQIYGVL
jgi:pyruvate formate lyase activating enzyme